MKWDLHVYDPKTQITKTHVRDYPGTTKSDGAAAAAYAARDLHKHMKYILAVPHYERHHATVKWQPTDLGFEAGLRAGEEQARHDSTPRETLHQLRVAARTDFERGLVAGYESVFGAKAHRSHATVKSANWHVRQLPSGRRVVEKTRGNKIARIFQGEGYWTVTINHAPRGPSETGGEITRQSAKTLPAAKSIGTRLLR